MWTWKLFIEEELIDGTMLKSAVVQRNYLANSLLGLGIFFSCLKVALVSIVSKFVSHKPMSTHA